MDVNAIDLTGVQPGQRAELERLAAENVKRVFAADEDWDAVVPFFYGRWDAAAQAHCAAAETQVNEDAASGFGTAGAFDPVATRAALAGFGSPVLVLAGSLDMQCPVPTMSEFAALFPAAQLVVQPGAGHYPWLDDAAWFVSAVTTFLDGKS